MILQFCGLNSATEHRIDPTVLAPLGRTSDKGNVWRSFLWSDGPSVGVESDGKGHCRTADGWKFLLLFRTALTCTCC